MVSMCPALDALSSAGYLLLRRLHFGTGSAPVRTILSMRSVCAATASARCRTTSRFKDETNLWPHCVPGKGA
jgi:hypothetical protein